MRVDRRNERLFLAGRVDKLRAGLGGVRAVDSWRRDWDGAAMPSLPRVRIGWLEDVLHPLPSQVAEGFLDFPGQAARPLGWPGAAPPG